MKNLIRTYGALALLISPLLASYAVAMPRTCEDIFAGEKKGSILSPATVTQRVIKNGLVRQLFGKKQGRAQQVTPSASYEPSAVTSRNREFSLPTPRPLETKSFRVTVPTSVVGIRWISNENLVLDGDLKEGQHELTLIATESGRTADFLVRGHVARKGLPAVQQFVQRLSARLGGFVKRVAADLGESSFLILQDPASRGGKEYRFVDRKTFADVRDPLESDSPIKSYGNFLVFSRLGRKYLTSIRPTDFGTFWNRRVERELPQDFVLDKVFDDGAVLEGELKYKDQALSFDGSRYVKSNFQRRYEIRDAGGELYSTYSSEPNEAPAISIRRKHDSQIQSISFDGRQPFDRATSQGVLGIFGEGSSRMLYFAWSGFKYIVHVGNDPVTDYALTYRVQDSKEIGSRFLRMHLAAGPRRWADEIQFVDKVTGQMHVLWKVESENTTAEETMPIDPSSFVTVEKIYPPSPMPGSLTSHVHGLHDMSSNHLYLSSGLGTGQWLTFGDIHTGKTKEQPVSRSLIRVYDIGSLKFLRQVEVDGDARIIPGTRVVRVEKENVTEFIDLLSESVLWTGPTSSVPRLSPDASRVAYLEGNTVYVKVLGDKLERRAF